MGRNIPPLFFITDRLTPCLHLERVTEAVGHYSLLKKSQKVIARSVFRDVAISTLLFSTRLKKRTPRIQRKLS